MWGSAMKTLTLWRLPGSLDSGATGLSLSNWARYSSERRIHELG